MRALILDMDGILIDSEPLWRKSMVEVFRQFGYNTTEDECRKTKGMNIRAVIQQIKVLCKPEWKETEPILYAIEEDLSVRIIREGKAVPGSLELLNFVRNCKNWKTGLATSSSRKLMQTTLKKLNAEDLFDACVCADKNLRAKPFPDIYLSCASAIQVHPSSCYAVEDSWHGICSASDAGMKVLAVPETTGEKEMFLQKTHRVYGSMKELELDFKENIIHEILN